MARGPARAAAGCQSARAGGRADGRSAERSAWREGSVFGSKRGARGPELSLAVSRSFFQILTPGTSRCAPATRWARHQKRLSTWTPPPPWVSPGCKEKRGWARRPVQTGGELKCQLGSISLSHHVKLKSFLKIADLLPQLISNLFQHLSVIGNHVYLPTPTPQEEGSVFGF